MNPHFGGWYSLDEDTIDKKVDRDWDGVYKIRVKRKKRGSNPPKHIKEKIKCPGQVVYIGSSYGELIGSGIRSRLMCHLKRSGATNPCMIKVRKSYDLEFSIKGTERKNARYYEVQEVNKLGEYPLCSERFPMTGLKF